MAAFTLAALKAEITTDPSVRGYAAHIAAGRMGEVAKLLNEVQASIAIGRGEIQTYEIFEATEPSDWAALSPAEKQRYQTMLGMGFINLDGPNVVASFRAMFAAGTATRANLIALRTRNGSRAEELFEPDVSVSHRQVAEAVRL